MLKDSFRRFKIRLFSWEYWPMWAVYLPLYVYYLCLAIKARSFFFFSAANPGIETGGMFFESKWEIFKGIPKHLYPATLLVYKNESIETITSKMQQSSITFPLIAKPDRGERGWQVKKIETLDELKDYANAAPATFLIQSYINYPLEFSIFYSRHPLEQRGTVTSVTYKKLLSVTGDGKSTLKELILNYDRAFLQKEVLFEQLGDDLNLVPGQGEVRLLVPYGNHVRGAEFNDYGHIIDEQLTTVFDNISKSISGFYYGRFDLRVASLEDLKAGTNISILELNGTGAEPAHIYDPNYSLLKAQKVLFYHYRRMYEIAIYNKKNGHEFMYYHQYKSLKQMEQAYKTQTD